MSERRWRLKWQAMDSSPGFEHLVAQDWESSSEGIPVIEYSAHQQALDLIEEMAGALTGLMSETRYTGDDDEDAIIDHAYNFAESALNKYNQWKVKNEAKNNIRF